MKHIFILTICFALLSLGQEFNAGKLKLKSHSEIFDKQKLQENQILFRGVVVNVESYNDSLDPKVQDYYIMLRKIGSFNLPQLILFPIKNKPNVLLSKFGDFRSPNRIHTGIDLKASKGEPIFAVQSGIITAFGPTKRCGWGIKLFGKDGATYIYCHFNDDELNNNSTGFSKTFNIKNLIIDFNQKWLLRRFLNSDFYLVNAGDIIGFAGNSGNARTTPTHLHFEIRVGHYQIPIDPWPYVNKLSD